MATEIERLKNDIATLTTELGRARLRQRLVDEGLRHGLGARAGAAADLALVGFRGEVSAAGEAATAAGTPVSPRELLDETARRLPDVFTAMRGGPASSGEGDRDDAHEGDVDDASLTSHALLTKAFADQRKAELARLEREAAGGA